MKITQDTPQQRSNITAAQNSKKDWIIKLAKQVTEDVKRAARRAQQLCSLCYYSPAIGGRAITPFECLRCKYTFSHGTSAVPVLCFDCARKTEQCCQCGADVEYREKAHETTSVSEEPKPDDL